MGVEGYMYKYDDGRKFVLAGSLISLLRLEKLQNFALVISSNGFAIVPVHSLSKALARVTDQQ